jgi:D-alanyl-D-alanine-carboxypeptidase/D-alanyl-D-alanine-endopeptidase
METTGMSRRRFVAGAAGAALAAATFGPLRAGAESAPPLVGPAWTNYMNGLVAPSGPSGAAYAWVDANGPSTGVAGALSHDDGAAAVTADSLFEIGSVTKVFTTTLLELTLANYSSVKLSTTIGQYLTGVTNTAINNLTLGQLAAYTNCVPSHVTGQDTSSYSYQDLVTTLNGLNPVRNCTPRSTYYYSNLAVGLLGLCIGVIWENDPTAWTTLVVDQIATPRGMTNTDRG